jgi:hypothetical protein
VSATLRAAALVALLGPLAGLAAVGVGQQSAPPARRVKVTIVVIFASEKGDRIDPRLKCIAAEVQKRNPQLKGFRVGSMECRSLAVGDAISVAPVKGETTQVVVRQAMDRTKKVELAVAPPCQGEFVYRTVCGKFFPVITRCLNDKQERLILAIRVQPCHGK